MLEALVEETYGVGAYPFIQMEDQRVNAALMAGMTPELADLMADFDVPKMEAMDAYIAIRGFDNAFESAGIPEERLNAYNAIYGKRVHMDVRIDHTNWVVLRWPTPPWPSRPA